MWNSGHDAYLESRVMTADPIELVNMLYGACTEAVRAARVHLAEGRIAERSRQINQACAILIELTSSLDHERGGEISQRLALLYDYMQRRLLEANMQQSDAPLADVLGLLGTLSEAWASVQTHQDKPAVESTPAPQPAAGSARTAQPATESPWTPQAASSNPWSQPAAENPWTPQPASSNPWSQPAAENPWTPQPASSNPWTQPAAENPWTPQPASSNPWSQPAAENPWTPQPASSNPWAQPAAESPWTPVVAAESPWAQPVAADSAWSQTAVPEAEDYRLRAFSF